MKAKIAWSRIFEPKFNLCRKQKKGKIGGMNSCNFPLNLTCLKRRARYIQLVGQSNIPN